ncbi:MAG TPA: hypothetical protein PKH50_02315 [bacterium]|nr:hypothetical protein [bacterium]
MQKKISSSRIISVFFPFILATVCIFVCYKNYTLGTYLTGWDTLHPEFNYGVYWKRIIFGAWQSHQGLGAPASQAHAAEIPRILLIQFLDIFFAKNIIRYLCAFLMLILGPLGVFFFLKKIIFKESESLSSYIGSFLGGLFYLLNLGTVQQFNVPLEMFLVQYAFLGWAFLFLTKFYLEGNRKDLVWFSIITFLGAPQAHTSTLFYVYVMFLFIYLLMMILLSLNSRKSYSENILVAPKRIFIKRGATIFLLTLLINSFWMLPNVYYGITRGSEISQSKIHHLFSDEAFLVNKKYGDIKNISILRNFLFDWGVYTERGSYESLLMPWIIHLKKPLVLALGYFFFFLILVGVIISLSKRDKLLIPWIIIGFLSVFFILNVNPPFGSIFVFLQEHIPLFKELFRFPFTKFSVFLMFVYAIFFGYATSFLISCVERILFGVFPAFIGILLSAFLIYFSFPAFEGYLINPAMRVDIPDRYFEMFNYFDEKKEYGRVLHLPIHSFWGWVTYSWDEKGLGYQGAGFLWFGIKQPLIDREFDRWNIANEQPYREISTAIYSRDKELLQKYLEKYKIRWLILDKSVLAPGSDSKVLFHGEMEKLFSDMDSVKLARNFGQGLLVYEYIPNKDYQKIEKIYSYRESSNSLYKEYSDPIYVKYGDYISTGTQTHQFLGFNSVDENMDSGLVYSDDNAVYLKLPYGDNIIDSTGKIPVSLYLREGDSNVKFIDIVFDRVSVGAVPFEIKEDGEYFLKFENDYYPLTGVKNNELLGSSLVSLSKGSSYSIYKLNESININDLLYPNLESCNPSESTGSSSYSISRIDSGFEIAGKNTLACVTSSVSEFLNKSFSGSVVISFSSDGQISDRDFCMLDSVSGLCIDHFVGGAYFVSEINSDFNRYNLRFFADARNSRKEVAKRYTDIKIFPVEEILNGSLSYDAYKNLTLKGYLTFLKKDYLTVKPREIFGNRRPCSIGQELNVSNFVDSGKGIVFNSTKGSLCDSYEFPLASHDNGYVLEVKADYLGGVPLRLCLTNEYSKRCDIEVSLPKEKSGTYFYFVPSMGSGMGYTLNISNYVFGDTMSKNELEYLSLIPVSYDLIKGFEISEPNTGNNNVFVFNEAYDPGWLAFCGIAPCPATHVKVNNWANGWVFENSIPDNIHIFFWPQIGEFIGFLLLFLSMFYSFGYKEKEV